MSKCKKCGCEFLPGRIQRGKAQQFCSNVCANRFRMGLLVGKIVKPALFKCPECLVEKIVPVYQSKAIKFCSQSCHFKYASKIAEGIRNCSICGCDTGIARKRKYRVCKSCRPAFHLANKIKNKLAANFRTRIIHVLQGRQKSAKSLELLGCSVEMFRDYIQSKFTRGMRWNNYGKFWHLDHIIPCASFDLTKPDEQRKCFHYSNHQPLEVFENLSKRDSIVPCRPELLISIK